MLGSEGSGPARPEVSAIPRVRAGAALSQRPSGQDSDYGLGLHEDKGKSAWKCQACNRHFIIHCFYHCCCVLFLGDSEATLDPQEYVSMLNLNKEEPREANGTKGVVKP